MSHGFGRVNPNKQPLCWFLLLHALCRTRSRIAATIVSQSGLQSASINGLGGIESTSADAILGRGGKERN